MVVAEREGTERLGQMILPAVVLLRESDIGVHECLPVFKDYISGPIVREK